jgi:DNA invertase Pin-like site-specific DNA recombinase
MLERQRTASPTKREGRCVGRVPTAPRQAAEVVRLRAYGITPSEIAVRLGIGRTGAYRVLTTGGGRIAEAA